MAALLILRDPTLGRVCRKRRRRRWARCGSDSNLSHDRHCRKHGPGGVDPADGTTTLPQHRPARCATSATRCPCPVGELGITLIPSCGQLGMFSECVITAQIQACSRSPPPPLGAAGTACAGNAIRGHVDRSGIRAAALSPQPRREPCAITRRQVPSAGSTSPSTC